MASYGGMEIFGSLLGLKYALSERDILTIEVAGILGGKDIPSLLAAEASLLAYADGIARTLVDHVGRVFRNVIFHGKYVPSPEGPKWTDDGPCLPYHAVFYGLRSCSFP